MQEKVRTLPYDMMKDDLGLNKSQREELKANVNICINCAAKTEFDQKLDKAVRVHVTGPLQLLKLLQESEQKLCFV